MLKCFVVDIFARPGTGYQRDEAYDLKDQNMKIMYHSWTLCKYLKVKFGLMPYPVYKC